MLRKIIALTLSICLAAGTFVTVYADDVQPGNMVAADEKAINETAGVLPNSPFYSLELKIEQLQTAITDSQEKLASLKAEFAAERAAEAIVMANLDEDELAEQATNEYLKLIASSAVHINKAIDAKDDAIKTMDSLNDSYSNSEQLLKIVLEKAPDESKEAIENALNEQDKAISAINGFYAAKKAFFDAKDQLEQAKRELEIAKKGGGVETIQIAEDKVKEAEALKDELEELKDAAELSKEEVKNLTEHAEKSVESGFKNIEKANDKMDKLEEKASKDAQKIEEKRVKENEKQLEKEKKESEKLEKKVKKAEEKARKEAQKSEEKSKEKE